MPEMYCELAEATSKTVRTIQRTLDSLRKKGLVERIGSDKSGYWEVKEPPTAFINCSSN